MSEFRTKPGFFTRRKEMLGNMRNSIDLSRHTGVLVVLCVVGVYGLFRILSPQSEAAQVKFVEAHSGASTQETAPSESQLRDPFSGPEYDKALRLRETSALGMAVSLSILSFNTRTGSLPANVKEITSYLDANSLLPPGLQISDGIISSERSTFHIAYRREPFSFEVLAVPGSDQGTQVLFRFPLPQNESNSVIYFEADRDHPAPRVLLTTEQLSAAGWRIRHWRGDVLTLNAATIDSLKEQSALLNAR